MKMELTVFRNAGT